MATTYDTTTLTGQYRKLNDAPASGSVEIIPNTPVFISATGKQILSGRIKVPLDPDGRFSVALPSTDDITLEPAVGRRYTVIAKLDHDNSTPTTRNVELPAGGPVDMADLMDQAEAEVIFTAYFTADDYADLLGRVADLETRTLTEDPDHPGFYLIGA